MRLGWTEEETHVPCRSAVVALGGVVVALAVAAHDEDLVSHIAVLATVVVEVGDPAGEALPLGLVAIAVVRLVGGVSSVDETKVVLGLELSASGLSMSSDR